jgi:hypothetical protein
MMLSRAKPAVQESAAVQISTSTIDKTKSLPTIESFIALRDYTGACTLLEVSHNANYIPSLSRLLEKKITTHFYGSVILPFISAIIERQWRHIKSWQLKRTVILLFTYILDARFSSWECTRKLMMKQQKDQLANFKIACCSISRISLMTRSD